jgi:hypothetical protein
VLAVAGDEGEVPDVLVEFGGGRCGRGAAGFEVVEGDAGEVGDDE